MAERYPTTGMPNSSSSLHVRVLQKLNKLFVFLSKTGIPGLIYGSGCPQPLSTRGFADLTDVTLTDEKSETPYRFRTLKGKKSKISRNFMKTLPEAQRTQGIASKTLVNSPAKENVTCIG